MNREFKNFSEATRLFAQYLEVVEEVERLYHDDITAFLDSVLAAMRMKLGEGSIGDEVTKEYRSWWIEDVGADPDADVAYLWLERKNSQIVSPGLLTVVAEINKATDIEKQQLSACKSELNLPSNCKVLDRRLFAVEIAYGEKEPVDVVAGPILSILQALHAVEKRVFAERKTLARP